MGRWVVGGLMEVEQGLQVVFFVVYFFGFVYRLVSCFQGVCFIKVWEYCLGLVRCLYGFLFCIRSRRGVLCLERCRYWVGSQKSCVFWVLVVQGFGCSWVQGMSEKREGSYWYSSRWVLEDCLLVRGGYWCLKRGLGRYFLWFWGLKGYCLQSRVFLCLFCLVSLSFVEGWSY